MIVIALLAYACNHISNSGPVLPYVIQVVVQGAPHGLQGTGHETFRRQITPLNQEL